MHEQDRRLQLAPLTRAQARPRRRGEEESRKHRGASRAIAREWLTRHSAPEDEKAQRRTHAEAAKYLGAIEGGDAERTTNAREFVRARLARRREPGAL